MPVKSIPIDLDKRRHLRFDWNALASLQKECGISLFDLQKMVSTTEGAIRFPFYEFRGLIWAGLLHESKGITLEEVGDLMDECFVEKLEEIGQSLFEAIMESAFFKAAQKKAQGPTPGPTPQTSPEPTGEAATTSESVTEAH